MHIFKDNQAMNQNGGEPLRWLYRHNKIVLEWVLAHAGISGNEVADQQARNEPSTPLIGPEPALLVLPRAPVQTALLSNDFRERERPRRILERFSRY